MHIYKLKIMNQYLHPCIFYSQIINFNFQLGIPIFKKEADEVLVLLVPIGELLEKCPSKSSLLSLHDIILCHRCSAHLNTKKLDQGTLGMSEPLKLNFYH